MLLTLSLYKAEVFNRFPNCIPWRKYLVIATSFHISWQSSFAGADPAFLMREFGGRGGGGGNVGVKDKKGTIA